MARTPQTATEPQAETPVATEDSLTIESVAWTGAGGQVKEPHPQLLTLLRKSWENRVENGNRIETPAYRLTCKTQEEAKLRTRQLREAGDYLKIGVGVRQYANPETGMHEVHFRARRRRGTRTETVVTPDTAEQA